jgi:hypothetical protein
VPGATEIVSLSSANRLTTAPLLSAGERTDSPKTKEIDVLKITRTETPVEEKWILQGHLVGLWVSELRRTWKETHRTDNNLKCIVDLNEVTFIDRKGERLLQTMSKEGAQFIATGLYIKHVLQQKCAR